MVLFQKLCLVVPPSDQDGCTAVLSLTQDPMGNSHKIHLVWNQYLNQNQTLMKQSLDGPLPKLCPAVALSHQHGRHSAVALLLKAALIQVSDNRLLGASGFINQWIEFKFENVKYNMWTKVIPFPPSSLYISYKTTYFHNTLMKSFLSRFS